MKLLVSHYPYDRWNNFDEMCRTAVRADELGIYGLQFSEHIVMPRVEGIPNVGDVFADNLVFASHLAALTTQIQLVLLVTVVPYRNPVILAKQLATLDHLSHGRTVMGFGTGWFQAEFEALGVSYEDRGELMDEYLQAIIELWTNDDPEFHGKHVSFGNLKSLPRPLSQPYPRTFIGGHGPRALRRMRQLGAGWAPLAGTPAELRVATDKIKEQMVADGRDPETLEVIYSLQVGEGDEFIKSAYRHIGQGEPPGSPVSDNEAQALLDTLKEYEAGGVTQAVLYTKYSDEQEYMDRLEWLASEVIPYA